MQNCIGFLENKFDEISAFRLDVSTAEFSARSGFTRTIRLFDFDVSHLRWCVSSDYYAVFIRSYCHTSLAGK